MLKKILLGFVIFLISLYILFLILPFCLSGVINNYTDEIQKIAEKSTGLKLNIGKIHFVSTPKLTIGGKFDHLDISLSEKEKIFSGENIEVKLSLIPIIFKEIRLDKISAENINLNLKFKNDGHLLLEDALVQNEESSESINQLPYNFKLSNHMPDIYLKNYKILFNDNDYIVYGNKFYLTDFLLNKKFKIQSDGGVILKDKEQFKYNIKILNQIMPDIDINELLFAPKTEKTVKAEQPLVNVIDIFDGLSKNNLTADVFADIKTSGNLEDLNINGKINISNFSVAVDGKNLPASDINLSLNGNKIKLDSKLLTSPDEITELIGNIKTGKHPSLELTCKSNAKVNSIINLIDSVSKSIGYNDLDSLSASGSIDANFTIKSNLKTVSSSGYFKIPSASVIYRLYNVSIDKIFADILFDNNMILIKDSGFSIFNQPLKLNGSISNDAIADLKLIADKLQLKGLLLAAGQLGLLKENDIKSGTVSMNAIVKGKLDKIVPEINLSIDNLNVKNIPSNTIVTVKNTLINLLTNGVKTIGNISIDTVNLVNPVANISVPKSKITLGEKDIIIDSLYLLLNNSRIDITGKISEYMSKNIGFNINANGKLIASEIKNMIPKEFRSEFLAQGYIPLKVLITGNDKVQDISFNLSSNNSNYLSALNIDQFKNKNTAIKGNLKLQGDTLKFSNTGIIADEKSYVSLNGSITDLYKSQKLNLNLLIPGSLDMSVPFFKNSKLRVSGNIDILGSALNPVLKGSINVPFVKIPDMLLSMDNMSVYLNGPVIKGKGKLNKFVYGGVVAENLTSEFNLANNVFYLNKLSGDAFKGRINGNISYNIINGLIGINMKGSGMDAENAIYGAAGIKNALSGNLNFDANLKTSGDTDVKIMKNLKGNATFDISNGKLGNIGRFDKMLLAQNIMANPVLKAGVNAIRTLPVIKSTAEFETINGNLIFSDGWINLSPVKTAGPSMAYYVTGKYNLINSTANVIVLGRISAEVVKLLGPLGDMSLSKLTSLIPGIGNTTAKIVQAFTTSPYGEKISEIPKLTSGNENFKNFKVQFNGGIESSSSVKSFRWLSVCDTSEIESMKIKDQVKNVKEAIKEAQQEQTDKFNKLLEEQRQQAQQANQELKNAAEGLKNLFKNKIAVPADVQTEEIKQSVETPAETSAK